MNTNSLDYGINSNVENFLNASFLPKVTRHNSTVIHDIPKNTILSKNVSSGIWKADISNHFLIFSYFNQEIISSRKDTYSKRNPNVAFNKLMRMFSKAYDTSFPEIQK